MSEVRFAEGSLTVDEAERELADLVRESGMTRGELEDRGKRWELNARERGILADVGSREFLVRRATR